ncbi:N-acetyltransferase [Dyella monticola]|uniref:N-acetyltransferase n=1 Tax=Dyella monticola TaxID=1927958 RepID=A0A370WSD1_9GAMM|nr:GNAT family N-acetyltransferase [Dyella monticola]RDS79058.1 N-acetyltransferase [Dyella monticola]
MNVLKTQLRRWRGRRRLARLPFITTKTTANYYKTFTAPNPDIHVVIYNRSGDKVGTAIYAASPLDDRVYVFDIKIAEHFRRKGYATALLWHLAQTCHQPITAIKELSGAYHFWHASRQLAGAGLVVTQPLSVSEMEDEAARWQHLKPVAKRLDKIITQRLCAQREPWAVAVGRGFDG